MRAPAIAAVATLLYVWLGAAVSHTTPFGIDLAGRALAGQAPGLALIFTESCWWVVLVSLAVVAIAVGAFVPSWRPRVVYALLTTLATWQISDALKNVFMRPRPDYWIVVHESSYSYSSGHAMFAVLVYWTWAWFLLTSPLPRALRMLVPLLLVLWGCGVIWSRLALGAHYVTDLIGGVLLAIAALAVASTIGAALRAAGRARASA
ncbi:MAG TPA: phosphatase PAP2 family protein [Candidatus Elarobacter sp.]|jgi:undecaprenyl-diphosphatase|nr:phosphatase PAP2 family protein [Candidatus Elarobacter sp.]